MDIVLGVSLAPPTVRLVLVEGEHANGVTVDQDDFTVEDTEATTDRVVSAVLGTRESARAGGYRLTSAGVTVSDQAQAAALRDALAAHKVDNVMLVSAFLAAAALAQTVGGALGQERTALLFVEPSAATVAVVDSSDGSILEAHHRALPGDDDEALTELGALVGGIDRLESDPDGVFVVGSGVNVAMIKPTLEAATALAVSVPEEPDMALARGAALASAQAPLFASSTRAVAWARDPGTGEVDKNLANLQYAYVPAGRDDYDDGLAYSAVGDEDEAVTTAFDVDEQRGIPLLLAGSALVTLFVIGVVALVIALASDMRPSANLRPNAGGNVIAPTQRAPQPA
ncbi:DUF7159 family protein, partial [Mycobacterium talmoniae]|uniref:DUF7159 family protein n=1 Tax=Mycobacterium talmoniae TaxID=1858794 RepID=UPI000B1E8C0F